MMGDMVECNVLYIYTYIYIGKGVPHRSEMVYRPHTIGSFMSTIHRHRARSMVQAVLLRAPFAFSLLRDTPHNLCAP